MKLAQAFQFPKLLRAAFVGAGGKTTAMFRAAQELSPQDLFIELHVVGDQDTRLEHFVQRVDQIGERRGIGQLLVGDAVHPPRVLVDGPAWPHVGVEGHGRPAGRQPGSGPGSLRGSSRDSNHR